MALVFVFSTSLHVCLERPGSASLPPTCKLYAVPTLCNKLYRPRPVPVRYRSCTDAQPPSTMPDITSASRQYLAAVYPTASLENDASIAALWSTLRFFYGVRVMHGRTCINATSLLRKAADASSPVHATPVAIEVCRRPTLRGMRVSASGCLEFNDELDPLRPASPLASRREDTLCSAGLAAEVPRRLCKRATEWIEVRHDAFGRNLPRGDRSASPGSSDWSDFMDGGAAGMWYYPAAGSGIFYRLGRTLTAVTKNDALAGLLEALSRDGLLRRSSWPPFGLDQLALCANTTMYTHPDVLASRVRFAQAGGAGGGCRVAGLWQCGNDHILGDAWDSLLVWLGRLLGYDTIVLRSTLCGCGWACGPCVPHSCPPALSEAHPEVIDLRVPDVVRWRADGLNRTLFLAGSPEWRSGLAQAAGKGSVPPKSSVRKHPVVASDWMSAYLQSDILSLRDPQHPLDANRATPCLFQASRASLGCANHPSASLSRFSSNPIEWTGRQRQILRVRREDGYLGDPHGQGPLAFRFRSRRGSYNHRIAAHRHLHRSNSD